MRKYLKFSLSPQQTISYKCLFFNMNQNFISQKVISVEIIQAKFWDLRIYNARTVNKRKIWKIYLRFFSK